MYFLALKRLSSSYFSSPLAVGMKSIQAQTRRSLVNTQRRMFFKQQPPPDFDPNLDYYKILGVSQTASEKEIKQKYYKLAQEQHPDRNQGKATDKFKEITAAYNVLGDTKKKQEYDNMRKYGAFGGQKAQDWSGFGQGFGQGFDPFGGFRQPGQGQNKQRSYQYQRYEYDPNSRQKSKGYTYTRTKDGKEYYSYQGSGQDFEEFLRKNQEEIKKQFENFQRKNWGSSGQNSFNDYINRAQQKKYEREYREQQQQYYDNRDGRDGFKNPFDEFFQQRQQSPISQMFLVNSLIRALFFFFGFLFVWKLLVGRRKSKRDQMDDYYLHQMYMNDPRTQGGRPGYNPNDYRGNYQQGGYPPNYHQGHYPPQYPGQAAYQSPTTYSQNPKHL